MIIRKATENDLDRILELNNKESMWVGGEATKEEIAAYQPMGEFLVSEESGLINGFIIALRQDIAYHSKYFQWFKERVPEFIYIDRVVVDEKARGKGIGTGLYNYFIEKRNKLPIVCEVKIRPEINLESVNFHENRGFREMGVLSPDGIKACRMYRLE